MCARLVLGPGWWRSVRHQVSADQGRGQDLDGRAARGGAGQQGARARASVWALPGMTTGSGPAPGGPWAGRTCQGRGLQSRPRRPAWPPPAHRKRRAGGYAGHGRGAGRSLVAPGGLRGRAGRGKGRATGRRDYPKLPCGKRRSLGPRVGLARPRRDPRTRWRQGWAPRRLKIPVGKGRVGRGGRGPSKRGHPAHPLARLCLWVPGKPPAPRPFPFPAPWARPRQD